MIVKTITPSILVQFSKFLCLNISAFQDISFSFIEHPRVTCPRGQKCVLKLDADQVESGDFPARADGITQFGEKVTLSGPRPELDHLRSGYSGDEQARYAGGSGPCVQ